MDKFEKSVECVKCGGSEVGIEYHLGSLCEAGECMRGMYFGKYEGLGEHFGVTCACGYRWQMECRASYPEGPCTYEGAPFIPDKE